mmetsp:Transcript_8936/g.12985  ORF Transcript_8936/g.12985 Transcript_8936/m.12985 type:complete len:238 (+) Transcript_8936:3-716(+)
MKEEISLKSRARLAPRNRSYFGKRTPLIPRFLSLLGYCEVARRGAALLFANDVDSRILHARFGVLVYTTVYLVETFLALCLHWISLQGVHMQHMYEHHLTGLGLGLALSLHILINSDSWDDLLVDLCHLPLSVGLLAHSCEACCVVRTFLPHSLQNHFVIKLVQRFLGAVCMLSLSVSIIIVFVRYVSEYYNGGLSLTELFIVPLALYLGEYLHPLYLRSHLRAMIRLVNDKSKRSS